MRWLVWPMNYSMFIDQQYCAARHAAVIWLDAWQHWLVFTTSSCRRPVSRGTGEFAGRVAKFPAAGSISVWRVTADRRRRNLICIYPAGARPCRRTDGSWHLVFNISSRLKELDSAGMTPLPTNLVITADGDVPLRLNLQVYPTPWDETTEVTQRQAVGIVTDRVIYGRYAAKFIVFLGICQFWPQPVTQFC